MRNCPGPERDQTDFLHDRVYCLSGSSQLLASEKQRVIDKYLHNCIVPYWILGETLFSLRLMVALPLTAVRLGLSVAVSCWVVQPRNREVTGGNLIKRTGMSWTEASITRTELIGRSSWWLLLLLEEYSVESKTILGPGRMITYPPADVPRIRQQAVNPWVPSHKAGDCAGITERSSSCKQSEYKITWL